MKPCKNPSCTQVNPQPLDNFYVHQFTKDGRRAICIECWKQKYKGNPEYRREYRARNLERIRAYDRQRIKCPEKKKRKSAYDSKWRKLTSAQIRANLLKRKFNSSIEHFDAMLAAQNGRCAVCRRLQSEVKKTFCFDHDHACCAGNFSCGKCIRGILCDNCNRGLGLLRDNPKLLLRAAKYLKKGN